MRAFLLVTPVNQIKEKRGRWFVKDTSSYFVNNQAGWLNQVIDQVDRRYQKEDPHCLIFTSNKQPNEWTEFFSCDDDLKAALDRIFDDAKVVTIKGESYRGRKREVLAVEAGNSTYTGREPS